MKKWLISGVAVLVLSGIAFAVQAGHAHTARAQSGGGDGLVNTGPIDPSTWKYGHAFDPPVGGSPIWNPAKKTLMSGADLIGGTVSSSDPEVYCSVANAGYDFTWTEMQHSPTTWDQVSDMWSTCPHAKAVPGVRVAYTNEREIQHALDNGAMVLVVPTVDSVKEAREVVQWAYFPPLGRRSLGGGPGFNADFWGNVPGGYRDTFNDNLVLIVMVETLEGVQAAKKIAKVPGVSAVFAASSDLGNFSGYEEGSPDYEKLVTAVHDATLKAGKKLCGPLRWKERPGFTCFQGSNQDSLIAAGAKAELGSD